MSDRLRVSIPDVPLVIQPSPEEAQRFAGPGRGESVRDPVQSAADRASGIRRLEVVVGGWRFEATVQSAVRAELRDEAAREAAAHRVTADITLRAQIPGRVVKVWVAVGDIVEAGQHLLAIEAMKMENEIRAPRVGTVTAVKVVVGTLVERNEELLTLA
ncbi:MAG: acetyl-CoA carboxylase biotin carboxyl carrier protein subunit [Chloroflexota bacterium]